MSVAPHSPAAVPGAPARAIAATAFAFLVTMLGTTLPTPLYVIYATQLSFSPLTVTLLFAVYAIGVVGALSLFGRLSDDLGRRPVLMIAVTLALLSALLFVLPPSLPLLITARILAGLGAGLMSGTGTAAIMDLFPDDEQTTAGTLAVAANTGGLAVGTLLAGALASATPMPLVTPFAAHLVLCVLALAGLAAWAPRHAARGHLRFRPQRLSVPASIRGAFARGVLAAGTGFAMTGVLTAVTALFLARDLGLASHMLAGFVVFVAFACMAVGQLTARRMQPSAALSIGCAGLVLAAGALAVALATVTLAPLIAAAIVLGVSCGLSMNAGIATTVGQVAPAHRGGVSSAFFAGLYCMLTVPAIGVGLLANAIGLREAGLAFTAVVAVLAASIGVFELVTKRTRPRS